MEVRQSPKPNRQFSNQKKRNSSLCARPVEGSTVENVDIFEDNEVWTYVVLQAVLFVQKQNKNGVWLLMGKKSFCTKKFVTLRISLV